MLPAVRYACDAYLNFCQTKPWIEAVASSLTELFGPAAIKVRLERMESTTRGSTRPGSTTSARASTSRRATRSTRSTSSSSAADLRAAAEGGRGALSFKLDMLWVQLDAIDLGDTRPQDART